MNNRPDAIIDEIDNSSFADIRKKYLELREIVGNNYEHLLYGKMMLYEMGYDERLIEENNGIKHKPMSLRQKQIKKELFRIGWDIDRANFTLKKENHPTLENKKIALKWLEELPIKREKLINELRELGGKVFIPNGIEIESWIQDKSPGRSSMEYYFKAIYTNILNDYDKETAKKWALSTLSVFKRVEGNRNFSLTVKNNYNDFKAWIDDTLFKIKRTKQIDNLKPESETTIIRVSLSNAGKACKKMKNGRQKKKDLIQICKEYLRTHSIDGKPDYTMHKLANYISVQKNKL